MPQPHPLRAQAAVTLTCRTVGMTIAFDNSLYPLYCSCDSDVVDGVMLESSKTLNKQNTTTERELLPMARLDFIYAEK